MDNDSVLAGLEAVVSARPDDDVLRLRLAELLIDSNRLADAREHLYRVLAHDPENPQVRYLEVTLRTRMQEAASALGDEPGRPTRAAGAGQDAPAEGPRRAWTDDEPADGQDPLERLDTEWDDADAGKARVTGEEEQPEQGAWEAEISTVKLADVGGMTSVKQRIEMSFLAPLRNPAFREYYGATAGGGLLLWGPPGCGKTFIARALAGELDAKIVTVTLSDVLSPFMGESERNVHELFEFARRKRPVVLFIDELDALGQKRSGSRNAYLRGTVAQLLMELDGAASDNDEIFVLGATNMPWDVDPALRRPGRFDRTVLVLPPDQPAREAILGYHLRSVPTEGVEVAQLAARLDGYTGADLALVCHHAAEAAMMESIASGRPRPLRPQDFAAAIAENRPSITPWLDAARNVVEFGTPDPMYDEIREYLKRQRRR